MFVSEITRTNQEVPFDLPSAGLIVKSIFLGYSNLMILRLKYYTGSTISILHDFSIVLHEHMTHTLLNTSTDVNVLWTVSHLLYCASEVYFKELKESSIFIYIIIL